MQLGFRIRKTAAFKVIEQHRVAHLNKIISALIGPVDKALCFGNDAVAGPGQAGFVFGMPDLKVRQVVRQDRLKEVVAGLVYRSGQLRVPLTRPAIVKDCDFTCR